MYPDNFHSAVYTGGTFDLFHAGHVNFLRQCAQRGYVTVALNTDEFIKKYKGQPPVMSYAEREAILLACKYVSAVVPNISGADSKPTISAVRPKFIVIGDDWLDKDYCKQMDFTPEWLKENRIELVYVPYTKNISTTEIKRRLRENQPSYSNA
jgi:glycerol-3-phosphate cytidylyltransferase